MCDYKISSEIHIHSQVDSSAKPTVSGENVVTRFSFKIPKSVESLFNRNEEILVDEDGDYILRRREQEEDGILLMEQKPSTPLELVGLQVWRGALLLSDFLLHHNLSLLQNATVLELGAGAGLTSIVAGMFAHEVICTDIDYGEIHALLEANKERNRKWIKSKFSIMELDFYAKNWSDLLQSKLENVSIILAADVIYDNDLTEAFVSVLSRLMATTSLKTVYVALEKRYVFTVADLDCVAPCYEHFLQCLSNIQSKHPESNWLVEQLPIDFPQYFNYERVNHLVLWKISSQ